MRKNSIVVGDALPYAAVIGVITAVAYYLHPLLAAIPGALLFFVLFFFRNPPRKIPPDNGILVSPADGTVMEICEVYEDRFIKGKAVKISIFLSVFNVHLNRTPVEGKVKYRSYRPGKMVPAFKSHASEINERNYVGIENDVLRVLVTQITGFIARRIVCWVSLNDSVARGQLFGMIKFGSCTEIIVPLNVEVLVSRGQKVIGGETVIGRLKDEH